MKLGHTTDNFLLCNFVMYLGIQCKDDFHILNTLVNISEDLNWLIIKHFMRRIYIALFGLVALFISNLCGAI